MIRSIEPGNGVCCKACAEVLKYRARQKQMQVIANVYENGSWDRVEHFHQTCYEAAGSPYGTPL